MVKDWGFIFKGDGDEHFSFNKSDLKTRIAGVAPIEQAVEVANIWADQGVQLIELCGWFKEEGADILAAAVGDRVAIGYAIASPKTEKVMNQLFAE